jgi:S1-C subfamily serine protease
MIKKEKTMKVKSPYVAGGMVLGLLWAGTVWAADQPASQAPYGHGDDTKLSNGVIGVLLQVGAERIGDPGVLYVGKVRHDGPAHQAGLKHGDEIVAVNGTPVTGKSYEQVVSMIRGEPGTVVKLEVKGTRELSITRVANDKVRETPEGSYGAERDKTRPSP